jgi:hypothetical protein
MKIIIDNNSDSNYSLHNLDNYNNNLNDNVYDIIKKFCGIIISFLKFILEKFKIKKTSYSRFIIIRGFETITNVFNNVLYYTKNLDLTYYHCQKAYYYYVEFIQQITEEQHVFLQLTSRDAATYVYKKNIFEINHDITKNMSPVTKDLKNKLDVVNKNICIFKYILETVLQNFDLENECLENKYELIDKLDIIYEHVYSLRLDASSIQTIQKCFEIIYEINYKTNATHSSDKNNEIYLDIFFTLLKKCSKNTSKNISTIEKNIQSIDLEEITINNIISFITT